MLIPETARPILESDALAHLVTIAPGESVVFVESMTPDEFRRWWGPANLRPDLQIIPYAGAALSLSSLGDAMSPRM